LYGTGNFGKTLDLWTDYVLQPIDQLAKLSEADEAILTYVLPRGKRALAEIRRSAIERSDEADIAMVADT
jgi:hypothetical protein